MPLQHAACLGLSGCTHVDSCRASAIGARSWVQTHLHRVGLVDKRLKQLVLLQLIANERLYHGSVSGLGRLRPRRLGWDIRHAHPASATSDQALPSQSAVEGPPFSPTNTRTIWLKEKPAGRPSHWRLRSIPIRVPTVDGDAEQCTVLVAMSSMPLICILYAHMHCRRESCSALRSVSFAALAGLVR